MLNLALTLSSMVDLSRGLFSAEDIREMERNTCCQNSPGKLAPSFLAALSHIFFGWCQINQQFQIVADRTTTFRYPCWTNLLAIYQSFRSVSSKYQILLPSIRDFLCIKTCFHLSCVQPTWPFPITALDYLRRCFSVFTQLDAHHFDCDLVLELMRKLMADCEEMTLNTPHGSFHHVALAHIGTEMDGNCRCELGVDGCSWQHGLCGAMLLAKWSCRPRRTRLKLCKQWLQTTDTDIREGKRNL